MPHRRQLAATMAFLALASLMLAAPSLVSAQAASTPVAGTPVSGVNGGLQHAVNRNYAAPGFAAMAKAAMSGTPIAATPGMEMATPGAMTASPVASPTAGATLVTASAFIFQYQTSDQAKSAFADSGSIYDAFSKTFTAQTKITLDKDSVTGVGAGANAWTGSGEYEGVTLSVYAIITYDRSDLYFTVLVAKGSSVKDATVNFTKSLIAVPAGTGEGTYNKNGTSTGGLWDKLPKKGDPILQGLVPINDMVIQ